MKRKAGVIVGLVIMALSALSCTKEASMDNFYALQVTVSNSASGEKSVTGFKECHLYAKGYNQGESDLCAVTNWESENSYYLLDISFPSIKTLPAGKEIKLTNFNFQNPFKNGGESFTMEYSGKIYMVECTETEAVLYFKQLKCNVLNTDFLFDGFVHCPFVD